MTLKHYYFTMLNRLFIIIFVCSFAVSCVSDEKKMQKLIKEYLYENLDDYKSYEPIEFQPSDSLFSDWTMDSMLPVLDEYYEKYSRLADSLQRERRLKSALGYSTSEIMETVPEYLEATFFTKITYKHLRDSIRDHFESRFIGYGIDHSFRAKNRLGGTEKREYQFIINPSKTRVIDVRDIEKGEAITNYSKIWNKYELEEIKHKEMLEKYQNYKERGEAFLEQNKQTEGVITTPSGLQYRVIQEGAGRKPREKSRVEVKYIMKTFDGQVLDDVRDKTVSLGLAYILKGFSEALMLMNTGAKYEIFIPYELGYGEKETNNVPPYCVLVAEVELVKITEY